MGKHHHQRLHQCSLSLCLATFVITRGLLLTKHFPLLYFGLIFSTILTTSAFRWRRLAWGSHSLCFSPLTFLLEVIIISAKLDLAIIVAPYLINCSLSKHQEKDTFGFAGRLWVIRMKWKHFSNFVCITFFYFAD